MPAMNRNFRKAYWPDLQDSLKVLILSLKLTGVKFFLKKNNKSNFTHFLGIVSEQFKKKN